MGLRFLEDGGAARITFAASATRVSFVPDGEGQPFCHLAFNIPENKIVAALQWQKARSAMLAIPERLRDPNNKKAARVYRTVARVRGASHTRFEFPGFPYEVSVEG